MGGFLVGHGCVAGSFWENLEDQSEVKPFALKEVSSPIALELEVSGPEETAGPETVGKNKG